LDAKCSDFVTETSLNTIPCTVGAILCTSRAKGGVFVRSGKKSEKIYSIPELRKLDFEQAAVFLVGHAYNNGDAEALALLEVMFPDPAQSQSSKTSTQKDRR
jgi:hypothetical protein